jgi:hypothetical protein
VSDVKSCAGLAETVVRLAGRAVENAEGVNFMFGEVASAYPLQILVEQRLLLPEDVLILTDPVISEAVLCRGADGKEIPNLYVVKHKLARADRVLLAKVQGGQAYVVLSKIYPTELLEG